MEESPSLIQIAQTGQVPVFLSWFSTGLGLFFDFLGLISDDISTVPGWHPISAPLIANLR